MESSASTVKPVNSSARPGRALDGPERCSGLPVQRHDGASVARLLGAGFEPIEEEREVRGHKVVVRNVGEAPNLHRCWLSSASWYYDISAKSSLSRWASTGCSNSPPQVIPTLAPGQRRTFRIVARATGDSQARTVKNTATASGPNSPSRSSSQRTTQ